MNADDIEIRHLTQEDPADPVLYRSIRLEALQANPEAFGSTFEFENEKPLSWFSDRLGVRHDAAYRTELTYMSAAWLLDALSWRLDQALDRNEKWGTWLIRGRLLWYLEAVIETTETARVLPGINKTAQGWLSELRRRCPDARALGLYPALATRSQ